MSSKLTINLLVLAATMLFSAGLAAQSKPKLVREPVQDEKSEGAAAEATAKPEYNPLKADKSINIGKYYFEHGKYAAAIGRFQEAIRYRPDNPDAYRLLARSYDKQKKYKEAIAALLEYEQKFPKSPYLDQLRQERLRLEQKR
jgi:predicted Zn-dependent protease